ncbi:MAG: rRNA methyltransferase [Planctomycetes bacterium]|nr:rRNA methyltransferase [Planctomycetota bacterium]
MLPDAGRGAERGPDAEPRAREPEPGPLPAGLRLVRAAGRLELHPDDSGPVCADFAAPGLRRRLQRAGPRSEPLVRASGLRRGVALRVLDATAGLGRDAFLLAWLGADVLAVERQPVIAALLLDALERARALPDLAHAAGRVRVEVADARQVLAALAPADLPEVVLLDPMFPDLRRSAAPRKELATLRRLLGDADDAAQLLPLALAVARRRVVVKRPAHAPVLGGIAPHHSLPGASTRFDVYIPRP